MTLSVRFVHPKRFLDLTRRPSPSPLANRLHLSRRVRGRDRGRDGRVRGHDGRGRDRDERWRDRRGTVRHPERCRPLWGERQRVSSPYWPSSCRSKCSISRVCRDTRARSRSRLAAGSAPAENDRQRRYLPVRHR